MKTLYNRAFSSVSPLKEPVPVISSVLAAIALPSLLNQVAKARASEARSNLGAIIRAYQAFRFENGSFTTDLTALDTNFTWTHYAPQAVNPTGGGGNPIKYSMEFQTLPTSDSKLNVYETAVAHSGAAGETFASVICESIDSQGNAGSADAQLTADGTATFWAGDDYDGDGNFDGCDQANSNIVGD